jgi:nucleotidyltransferase AbiEii toxin of type IV toxin-antitoxin system
VTAVKRYESPLAFKAALEARQRERARQANLPFDRVAQVDLFFRFLDRMQRELGAIAVLKGGLALELRLHRARTTGDIDLRAAGDPRRILERLRRAGRLDRGDFLTFDVSERTGAPAIDGDGVIYEGVRFRAQTVLAGRSYRNPFGVDIAFGDPIEGSPDLLPAPDALAFVGIAPPIVQLYPLSTHLAEKLHALTLPRTQPNGRMKDLVDLALIAVEPALLPPAPLDAASFRRALDRTFAFRKTHPLPAALPAPPIEWATRYPRDRDLDSLPWPSITAVHTTAATFLDPILAATATGSWRPLDQGWR